MSANGPGKQCSITRSSATGKCEFRRSDQLDAHQEPEAPPPPESPPPPEKSSSSDELLLLSDDPPLEFQKLRLPEPLFEPEMWFRALRAARWKMRKIIAMKPTKIAKIPASAPSEMVSELDCSGVALVPADSAGRGASPPIVPRI